MVNIRKMFEQILSVGVDFEGQFLRLCSVGIVSLVL